MRSSSRSRRRSSPRRRRNPVPLHVEHVMGMPIVVELRGEDVVGAVVRVFDWFRFVDETFSTYKAESEISRLARGELAPENAHADVREVLARCDELRGETDGYFDARAGG